MGWIFKDREVRRFRKFTGVTDDGEEATVRAEEHYTDLLMLCPYCGKQSPDAYPYCPHCGARVEVV